jgi:hypothetical protein
MEHHHFYWENPLLMAIFNSYVKLPEGKKKQKKIPRENSSENSHVLGVHSESS